MKIVLGAFALGLLLGSCHHSPSAPKPPCHHEHRHADTTHVCPDSLDDD